MKKIIIYILTIVLLAGMYSCFKDKGNYDYNSISELELKPFNESYEGTLNVETFVLAPDITTTTSEDKLSYIWAISKTYETTGGGFGSEIPKTDTIGREKKLVLPIDMTPGSYFIYFTVTNSETGASYFNSTTLVVKTLYSKGFYVLKDIDGNNSDVDLFSERTTSTPKIENVLTTVQGAPIPGKPTAFQIYGSYIYLPDGQTNYLRTRSLNIITDKDVWIVDTDEMKTIYTHNTMHYADVPSELPYFMRENVIGITYAGKSGYYGAYQMYDYNMNTSGKFGYPEELPYEVSDYTVNKNMTYATYLSGKNKYGMTFFFDETHGRFVTGGYNNDLKIFTNPLDLDPILNPPPKPNDIEHNLIFIGGTSISSNIHVAAIFTDKDDPDKRYLYKLEIASGKNDNPVKFVRTLDPTKKINDATMFAMSERDAIVLYYVHDNKLYMYNVNDDIETEMLPKGLPIDEEITYIGHRYYDASTDETEIYDNLAIGTYKDGNYKIYMYNRRAGGPDGDPAYIFSGKGKAFSLQFVSPNMDDKTRTAIPGASR